MAVSNEHKELKEMLKKRDKREISILFLNEQDMIDAGVLDAGRCVEVMGEAMALLEEGDYLMGGKNRDMHGLELEFPKKSKIENFPLNDAKDRRFIAMPAYLGGRFHVAGEKWYGSNGRNRQKGFPRSILMATLNDVETGAPLAYMSANLLSSMRTGAMPGLAVKLVGKPDARVLSLVGPGVINKSSFRAIMANMKQIDTVRIKGSNIASKTGIKMIDYINKEYPQIKTIELCETLEQAIRGADIISEAVSCNHGEWPLYKREWLKPGAVLVSLSTFNMDKRTIKDVTKIVDNYGMYENYANDDELGYDEEGVRLPSGCMGEEFVHMVQDGLIDRESIIGLGEIVTGKKQGRTSDDEIFLVSIEGMPIEDVAWGYECYINAKKLGVGTDLNLWENPIAF